MRCQWVAAVAASMWVLSCGKVAEPEPTPSTIRTTYRVVGGVSMGAIGGTALALTHPEKVDAVAGLGGPIDAAFFQRFLDRFLVSGFCPRERLEALAAAAPASLNDPAVIGACSRVATPGTWEHPNDFNHWHVTDSGGTFGRDSYVNLMTDLMLAYGNFFTENPASPLVPPGVPPEFARHPPADACTNPVRVKGLRNLEFNPEGAHDSITFCDGPQRLYFCRTGEERVNFCSAPANVASPVPAAGEQAFADAYCATKGGAFVATEDTHLGLWLRHAGTVDPCRQQTMPQGLLLAVDFNGNGRRDYGEPIVNNGHERFDDVGGDGCGNAQEDGAGGCTAIAAAGDPNGDDYDVVRNPAGTEQDWRWTPGEPFRDHGLDGVAGTGDAGEGNGAYDEVAGRKRLFALDGRSNVRALAPAARSRLHFLFDGGIHDIFNFGLMAQHLFSAVKLAREGAVGEYRDFLEIPGMKDRTTGSFNPWNRAWRSVPRDLLMLYGKEARTEAEVLAGEGDHVGTNEQALARFQVLFNWIANLWPSAPRPVATFGESSPAEYRAETFYSQRLRAKWEYSVSLPPGYADAVNAGARYPVAYLLHGYGMDPKNFLAVGLVANNFVIDPALQLRPVIYVFPNGRCCFTHTVTGARDCRNTDDQGRDLESLPEWERECHSGTFWVNRQGYTPEDATPYGDALFELMEHIDQTYRTLPTADVEAR